MKRNIFKNNKLLFSWTMSYIAIFIIQILMSVFVYTQSMNNVLNQIKMKNDVMVAQMQDRVNMRIAEMEEVMLQIVQNNDIEKLLKYKNREEISIIIKEEIRNYFTNLKFGSQFIDGIYLYLHDADFVISDTVVADSTFFFNYFCGNKEAGINEMEDFLRATHTREVTSVELMDDVNNKTKYLAYLQSMPWITSKEKAATLIIVAEESKFFDFKDMEYNFEESKMFVTDENYDILISDNSVINAEEFIANNKAVLETVDDEYIKVDGDMVKIINAPQYGLKFFVIIDEASYTGNFNTLKLLIIVELIFANLIGLFLCIYLAKRNYMPIQKIVSRFKESFSNADDEMKNEMDYISTIVDKVVEEKFIFEKRISNQNKIMKNYYLRLLLEGKNPGDAKIVENMRNFGINFTKPHFLVVLVKIRTFDSFFAIEENLTGDEKVDVVKFLISNVLEELFDNVCVCYSTGIDKEITAYIVNCDDDALVVDKLQDLTEQAREFMNDNFSIVFDAAISNIHKSVYGLNEAYYEAVLALDNIQKDSGSTRFEDVAEKQFLYPFTSELEQKFINMLRNSDCEAASEELKYSLSEFVKNGLYDELLVCFKYDILSAILKTVNIESSNPVLVEMIDKVSNARTPAEVQNVFDVFIKFVCKHIKETGIQKKGNELSEKIYKFIEDNYKNPDLNVAMIADNFSMSGYYVSLRFKEAYGEKLKSFINKYRIEKSLSLLTETNMSILKISSEVGFIDSNAYIRVFKQYQSVTPAKYRENNKN